MMGRVELKCDMEGTATVEPKRECIACSTLAGAELMTVADCEGDEAPTVFTHWSQLYTY